MFVNCVLRPPHIVDDQYIPLPIVFHLELWSGCWACVPLIAVTLCLKLDYRVGLWTLTFDGCICGICVQPWCQNWWVEDLSSDFMCRNCTFDLKLGYCILNPNLWLCVFTVCSCMLYLLVFIIRYLKIKQWCQNLNVIHISGMSVRPWLTISGSRLSNLTKFITTSINLHNFNIRHQQFVKPNV